LKKNGVFLKIYLSFWVTTALILAAQVGLDRLTDGRLPRPFHLEQSLKPALLLHSHTILQRYRVGDSTGMAQAREDLKNSTGLDAYVVDGNGREIGERPLSEDVRGAISAAVSSGKVEVVMPEHGPLIALPIQGKDGTSFVTVARMPRPGPPPPRPPRSLFIDIGRLLVFLLVSAAVCYWLARYMVKPVVELQELTRRFAGGDLSARIGENVSKRKDEFGSLADDFNRMAQRIESLMTQQRQLLGDISHELRSPLARLNLAVEIARKKAPEEAGPALARIETEAGMIEEMISQVLTLTRLEARTRDVQMFLVDMQELVDTIAADGNFEAQARNCAVRVTETVPAHVKGNEELLRRAVENIVRNAVRYTNLGTSVDIVMRRRGDALGPQVEIEVSDHGPGVPERELSRLFDPFYRVSTSRERASGGAGLGLAITARSVAFHGGSVTACRGKDDGLVVSITLPLSFK
jgi:two-component system, OmpR family, sensor histidine kinase CpxA